MSVFYQLLIGSGICWTLTYILIIRRGVLDLTYGMPAAALLANLAWELIYSFLYPHAMPQLAVDRVWFIFDGLMLLQFIRFGPAARGVKITPLFYLEFLFGFVVAFVLIILLGKQINDVNGVYAAFGQNLMMSVLFMVMLRDRRSSKGQSLYIALFKMLGTLLASAAFFWHTKTYSQSYLLQFLFVAIFVYDVIYTIMLYYRLKREKLKPFKRW